jgi:hypothetical protein
MPTIQERVRQWFLSLVVSRDTNWIARVRRTLSAAVLRALLARCWNGGSQGLPVLQLPQRGVLSMRVHLDRKQPDGAAIAFVVITLLTVVAFAILLSRLNGFV